MNIIGLDLSMKKTGVAVVGLDGELIYSELIDQELKTSKKGVERANDYGHSLYTLYYRLSQIIKEYEPMAVSIEKGFTRFNLATQVLYRVHGVANMAFRDIDQVYYTTKDAKKQFTGSGKASKQDMIDEVKRRFDKDVSEDEADAIAVALCLVNDI